MTVFIYNRETLATQLTTMMRLQDEMNTMVHPEWRAQGFAWHRAFWIEMAEMCSHFSYKWWKKETPDMPQVHLEIVDGFHFGISALMVERGSAERAVEHILSMLEFYEYNEIGVLDAAETLVSEVLATRSLPVVAFTNLLFATGLDFDELYRQYIGKNMLNRFRSLNGYKEGSYIKIWNGREDNEHLTEIMDSLDLASPTFSADVLAQLGERYPQPA